jgi:hypothetical protein
VIDYLTFSEITLPTKLVGTPLNYTTYCLHDVDLGGTQLKRAQNVLLCPRIVKTCYGVCSEKSHSRRMVYLIHPTSMDFLIIHSQRSSTAESFGMKSLIHSEILSPQATPSTPKFLHEQALAYT